MNKPYRSGGRRVLRTILMYVCATTLGWETYSPAVKARLGPGMAVGRLFSFVTEFGRLLFSGFYLLTIGVPLGLRGMVEKMPIFGNKVATRLTRASLAGPHDTKGGPRGACNAPERGHAVLVDQPSCRALTQPAEPRASNTGGQ